MAHHSPSELVFSNFASQKPERKQQEQHQQQRDACGLEVVPFENPNQNEFLAPKEIIPGRYEDVWPEPIHEIGPSTPGSSSSQKEIEKHPEEDEKPGWAQNKRLLTILAIFSVVVLCAIVGGVLGYFFTRKGQGGQEDEPVKVGIQISPISRLAATNWTDSSSEQHRAVYFQDETDSLITRTWTEQTGWETYNITENILSNRSLAALVAQAPVTSGTVLATSTSAYPFYQTNYGRYLYFIDTNGYFRCYRSWTNYTATHDEWEIWERSLDQANGRVLPETFLAATTYYHHKQERDIRTLAFQDEEGKLLVASDELNWGNPSEVDNASDVGKATPLAFSNFAGGVDTELDLAWLLEPDGGYIKMASQRVTGDSTEHSTESFSALDTTLSGDGRTELTVTSWDGGLQTLWVMLQANGNVAATWHFGNSTDPVNMEKYSRVRFEGYDDQPTPKWQSIAAADDGWFYGISNGTILEYKLDETDRDLFHFNSVVL